MHKFFPVDYNTQLLKNKHVLLIEDDEVNQMLLSLMITDQGASIALEIEKERIFECMKKQKPDLILLDTSLEHVNALEFTRQLRQQMQVNVPIIGMSSVNLQGRGLYHGLDEVLLRPVEYKNLRKALKLVMETQ